MFSEPPPLDIKGIVARNMRNMRSLLKVAAIMRNR